MIVLHTVGYNQLNISEQVNCSRSSVQKIVKKYIETGDVVYKKKFGHPKKLNPCDEQFLKVSGLRNRKKGRTY